MLLRRKFSVREKWQISPYAGWHLLIEQKYHSYPKNLNRSLGLEPIMYRVVQKSKPLPNYQKIVLNRIKVCQWD